MNDITPHQQAGSPFDAIRRNTPEGREFWSARDLMPLLGYEKWERFAEAVNRAVTALTAQGADVDREASRLREPFGRTNQMGENFHLSRFAAYQVAMCGDPRKPEVAAALAYFAIRTREAETAQPALTDAEIMALAVQASQRTIEQRDARIHQLEQKATVDAPKVTYVDTYVTDADLLSFSTVASTCGVTEKALRELLIEKDWIYRQEETRWSNSKGKKETRYRYTEKASKKRHFRRVEVHEAPRFRGEVMHTLKITPQGAEAIARLVAKEMAA